MLKNRRKFQVTQKEYEKEGEELKRSKAEAKRQKKQARMERKNRHPLARKIWRMIWIVLGCLVGAFALYILLGSLLMALRH
jgi:hypothetical protein